MGGDAQGGGCAGCRGAGAKSWWFWRDLQSLWPAKPFLLVLTATAMRHPQTDGSPPAQIQLLQITEEVIKGKAGAS